MHLHRPPTPRHATNTPRPTLRDLAEDIRREYLDAWRTATARDVPTSTPAGVIHFQRIWRPLS